MKRFLIFTKAMFLVHLRNRTTLFWNLVFPLFLLVIYAVVFGRGNVGSVNYMVWVIPGVLVYNILTFGIIASPAFMVEFREKGILYRLKATPLPAAQLVSSYLLVNVLISLLQCILLLAAGVVFLHFPLSPAAVLRTTPLLIFSILASVSIGQLVGGVSATAGVAVAIGQILNFSQMFVTDLVLPIQMMPDWLQKIAHYLPAYAIVQLVRPTLVDGSFSPALWINLGLALGYALVAAALAARFFRWEPRP